MLKVFCPLVCSLCATSQVYYSEQAKTVSCEKNCAAQTKCGDYIVIPEEHLDVSDQLSRDRLDHSELVSYVSSSVFS